MCRSLISAAIFSFVILPASHAGNYAAPPNQVVVSYGDLDIAQPAGWAALNARIHAAAVKVCGPVERSFDTRGSELMAARDANHLCIQMSTQRAVAQVVLAKSAKLTRVSGMAGN